MTNKFISLILSYFQVCGPTYSTGYLASPNGSPVYISNKACLNPELFTFTSRPSLLFILVGSITVYSLSGDLLENQPYFCISTSSKCYHWPTPVNSTSLTCPVRISSLHPNVLWPYFMYQYDLKETFNYFLICFLYFPSASTPKVSFEIVHNSWSLVENPLKGLYHPKEKPVDFSMASNHFQDLSPPLHSYLHSCQCQCMCMLSHVWLFVTPCTVAHQAPLSMEFPRQEYRSGLLFLIQGFFPTQGLNLHLLRLLHCKQILYHLSYQGSQPSFMKYYVFSCVKFFATLWTVVHQAPLPMEFYRQEHWSRVQFYSPGHLSNPEIKPKIFTSPALAGRFFFFNHCISLTKPYYLL